jgi:oligoribonuclease (3'-5' exoribonuclease)
MGWIFIKIYYESSDNDYCALVKTGPNKLKELINDLRSQDNRAKSLCDKLDEELIKQKGISLPTVIQLSKWCNTGVSYVKGESIANKISELLFNKILPRLD